MFRNFGKTFFRIIVFGGLALAIGYLLLMTVFNPTRSFDSNLWKTAKDHTVRANMFEDLIRKHKLIGMTRNQIIDLLGPGGEGNSMGWDMSKPNPGSDETHHLYVDLKDDVVVNYDTKTY